VGCCERPAYKHTEREVYLYYWDERGGYDGRGWLLGPEIGAATPYGSTGSRSPLSGWCIPVQDAVDEAIFVRSSAARTPTSRDVVFGVTDRMLPRFLPPHARFLTMLVRAFLQ
jgi:hypothetical protein